MEEGRALHGLGLTHEALGETGRAIEFYNESLTLTRAVGDRGGEYVTLKRLGRCYARAGDHARALESNRQAGALGPAAGGRPAGA